MKRLYFKLREEVFSQPDVARRSQSLDGFLQAHLGTQMKMTDIQHPRYVNHYVCATRTNSLTSKHELLQTLVKHFQHRIVIGALYKGSTKVEVRLFNNCFHDDYSDGE